MKWFPLIVITSLLFLLPSNIYAFEIANTFFGAGTKHLTLGTIYNPIIEFVYILGGLSLLFSFLYGGFKIIQGTAKDLEEGRNIIFYSFVGIIALVSVYWVTQIVGTIIGTNPTSGATSPTTAPPPPITSTPTPVIPTGLTFTITSGQSCSQKCSTEVTFKTCTNVGTDTPPTNHYFNQLIYVPGYPPTSQEKDIPGSSINDNCNYTLPSSSETKCFCQ